MDARPNWYRWYVLALLAGTRYYRCSVEAAQSWLKQEPRT
jgi:hypothetical protein